MLNTYWDKGSCHSFVVFVYVRTTSYYQAFVFVHLRIDVILTSFRISSFQKQRHFDELLLKFLSERRHFEDNGHPSTEGDWGKSIWEFILSIRRISVERLF